MSMKRSESLPELERSQIKPYLMNMKFSRQTARKPINTLNVHDKRFEISNLFPANLSHNKKYRQITITLS